MYLYRSPPRIPPLTPLTFNTSNVSPWLAPPVFKSHLAVKGGHLAEHGGGAAMKARRAQNHQIATLKLRLGRWVCVWSKSSVDDED